MERYICIHGHFYQPPRENPWLEAIELQDSAYPEHDWNERVTAECYAPNATSRILDGEGRIVQIVNNYARMSFNFGPTLLAWMEAKAPDVYEAVLEADRVSRETFSGHGCALAQAYNHMILPLGTRRDKYTQIRWGIRDFEKRFGRKPEGMWLPETAVDLETLEILAELGIRFTILAPHQAARVRPLEDGDWWEVGGGNIDPTTAYKLFLPQGREINLFFYDGPLSRAVAFEGLLANGQEFAQRLLDGFSEDRTWPQIVHIATDGETYGHHHRFGEMALSYAMQYLESENLARLTNYGEYLEKHPPTHEVEIFENSSWSCFHGIERWRSDCGCNSGGNPGWNQAWRAPLREALDWLRDTLAPAYGQRASWYLRDPWKARDDYIEVVLDRSEDNLEKFLARHAVRKLSNSDTIVVLKLLELQRHAMLMYTSCGWFFDELSGIETVQVIQYAGRALQLSHELFGGGIKPRFLELLARARSNIPAHSDGRAIFEKFVEPAALDLDKVCAHYALSSLFEDYAQETMIFCYKVDQQAYHTAEAGRARLGIGRLELTSTITREFARLCFGVLHWGDHNFSCCVRQCTEQDDLRSMTDEASASFTRGDFPGALQLLERYFGRSRYSLRDLFRDEQRKILDIILESALTDAEAVYRQVYEYHAPLLRFLKDLGIPPPAAFYTAAQISLNGSLRRGFQAEDFDLDLIEHLLEEARLEGVSLDTASLEIVLRKRIEGMGSGLAADPASVSLLKELDAYLGVLGSLPFQVNLRKLQNVAYEMLENTYPDLKARSERGEKDAREWLEYFRKVCEKVWLRLPE